MFDEADITFGALPVFQWEPQPLYPVTPAAVARAMRLNEPAVMGTPKANYPISQWEPQPLREVTPALIAKVMERQGMGALPASMLRTMVKGADTQLAPAPMVNCPGSPGCPGYDPGQSTPPSIPAPAAERSYAPLIGAAFLGLLWWNFK